MQQAALLPPQYQQVEYIARVKDGAYIVVPLEDLNLSGCTIDITVMVITSDNYERAFAGATGTNIRNTELWEAYFNNNSFNVWSGLSDLIVLYNGTLAINSKGTVQVSFAENKSVGLILGQYRTGAYQTDCRIYSVSVNNDGHLLANYIPCYRKSDSEIGMYDTVSKTFYTNAGTGEFTIPA